MNCQQVGKLLYLYCDGQLQPHLRQEIQAHVENCPACKINLSMTEIENEALRYTEDVPPLGSDFCQKVMLSIRQGQDVQTVENEMPTRRLKGFFSPGNLSIAGGIAATVLLFMMLVNSNILPVYNFDGKPRSPQLFQSGNSTADVALTGGKTPGAHKLADKTEETDSITRDRLKKAQEYDADTGRIATRMPLDAPDYSRTELGTASQNRGVSSANLQPAISPVQSFPQPCYIPAGYTLIKVENDLDNILTLSYENNGDLLLVRVIPRGGENFVLPALQASSNQAQKQPGLEKDYGAATPSSKGLATAQNESADILPDSPAMATAALETEYRGRLYTVQVTGTIPPEELARIATSCR